MKKRQKSPYFIFLLVIFLLGGLTYYTLQPYAEVLSAYLLSINLATFLLYGYDKFISLRTGLRVPENILHLLELAGGSPSALFAQHFFRHKVSKTKFQWIFWFIMMLQALFIYFLLYCDKILLNI